MPEEKQENLEEAPLNVKALTTKLDYSSLFSSGNGL
jgi:hypothetical protein